MHENAGVLTCMHACYVSVSFVYVCVSMRKHVHGSFFLTHQYQGDENKLVRSNFIYIFEPMQRAMTWSDCHDHATATVLHTNRSHHASVSHRSCPPRPALGCSRSQYRKHVEPLHPLVNALWPWVLISYVCVTHVGFIHAITLHL